MFRNVLRPVSCLICSLAEESPASLRSGAPVTFSGPHCASHRRSSRYLHHALLIPVTYPPGVPRRCDLIPTIAGVIIDNSAPLPPPWRRLSWMSSTHSPTVSSASPDRLSSRSIVAASVCCGFSVRCVRRPLPMLVTDIVRVASPTSTSFRTPRTLRFTP